MPDIVLPEVSHRFLFPFVALGFYINQNVQNILFHDIKWHMVLGDEHTVRRTTVFQRRGSVVKLAGRYLIPKVQGQLFSIYDHFLIHSLGTISQSLNPQVACCIR